MPPVCYVHTTRTLLFTFFHRCYLVPRSWVDSLIHVINQRILSHVINPRTGHSTFTNHSPSTHHRKKLNASDDLDAKRFPQLTRVDDDFPARHSGQLHVLELHQRVPLAGSQRLARVGKVLLAEAHFPKVNHPFRLLLDFLVDKKQAHLENLYAESGQTLQGSFSAVSKPNSASKYSLESSRRDLHNALLCTAL